MWEPKRDSQMFWYLDMFFKPKKKLNGSLDRLGKRLLRNHNCFRTKQEAQDAAYAFQSYLICSGRKLFKY